VVAFNRGLAVTPKHRSQQIAVFLQYSKCQSLDCAETVQRVYCDYTTIYGERLRPLVVQSLCGRTTTVRVVRPYIEHAAITASLDRPYCDLRTTCTATGGDRQTLPIKG